MRNQKTIQDELRNLESSLPVIDSPAFSIPDGYFDGLAAALLEKVKTGSVASVESELNELSPLLAGLPKTTPYAVPSSYFSENLNVSFQSGDEASVVLNAVGKDLPYNVPVGYFDTLPERLLATVTHKPAAKVVPLFGRTWMRVAAAAAVVGGLVLGGLQVFGDKQTGGAVVGQQPVQVSQTAVAKTDPAIEKEIEQASTKELEEFIESVPSTAIASTKKENKAVRREVEDLLKDVSVNEMESFLSALPVADDDLTATN